MRQRHELIARVIQMRRGDAMRNTQAAEDVAVPADATLSSLEERAAHLEKLVAGLQDSVHRESTRQRRQLAELEAQLEPAAIEVALSGNARRRKL
ncbi:MAG: hypothetical protein M3065_19605 [Actinomycetota bacterium]|nr:hypothetical protein [Actinomycetota bacterium]